MVYSPRIKVSSFSLLWKGRERLVEHRQESPARPGASPPQPEKMPNAKGPIASGQRRRLTYVALSACRLALGGVILALIGGGVLVARLAWSPIVIDGLGPRIASALDERFGRGYEFSLGHTMIVKRGYAPTLDIDGLSLTDGSGRIILNAPRAEVSVGLFALLAGRVTPKRLEVFDVEVDLTLLPDGSIAQSIEPDSKQTVALTPPLAESLAKESAPPLAAASAPGHGVPPQGLAPPQDLAPQDLVPPDAGSAQALSGAPPPPKPRALLVKQMSSAIRLLVDTLTNPESPIAAVDRVGVTRGRVVIDDQTTNQTMIFNGVNLDFDRTSGATTFNLSVNGPNGRWSAAGRASGAPGAQRSLVVSLRNLSIDEILLATGARSIGADFDMPLSAEFSVGLQPNGVLSEAVGAFDFGAGFLRFDDPNDEPMMVDSIHGGVHWDGAKRRIVIDRSKLVSGATHGAVSGAVVLPDHEGDPWLFRLVNAEPVIAAPERPGQKPVLLEHVELSARLLLTEKKFVIDRFFFTGPECGFAMAGDVDWTNGPHFRLGASAAPTPIAVVTRLWPSFIVAPVRSYLLDHVKAGSVQKATFQVDFDAENLAAMRAAHAPPDSTVLFDFTIANASLDFLHGVPPLRGVDGTGHVTGRTSTFTVTNTGVIDAGAGRQLTVAEGSSFHVADAEVKPTPAVIVAKVSSSVETIGDLLSRDALKAFANLPLDQSTLKGQVDGRLEIDMNLRPDMGPADTSIKINAAVTNFVAENLLGKEKLDAATLTVTVDPSGLRASGQGRMFGSPATVDMVRLKDKSAEASIHLTLDDAARVREGFGDVPGVSGPIGATVSAPLGAGERPKAEVELDLTHVGIDWPGVAKPPGRPGKAKFSVAVNEASTLIDQIVFEAAPVQARGSLELGPGEALLAVHLPQLKLSSGDDMKLDATRAGDGMKVVVRGSTIDARPFLKSLVFASSEGVSASASAAAVGEPKEAAIKEVELDVKSGVLSGYNKQVVAGAELRLLKRGDQIQQFSFSGRFGRETISGNLTGAAAAQQFNIMTDDAGSLLSFVDLYKHMERGRLSAGMRLGPAGLSGLLVIDGFILRDEPALRRLVAEGVPPTVDATRKQQTINAGAMAFNKLQVRFQRAGSRLELREGTMNGAAIGLTVDGWLDYAHDRVDVTGTFVPVYAVNNLFSQIPVFGLILGGGANEGLFGVNYRVEGSISAPTLSINPLSAIAPGIFRQIFGVADPHGPGAVSP